MGTFSDSVYVIAMNIEALIPMFIHPVYSFHLSAIWVSLKSEQLRVNLMFLYYNRRHNRCLKYLIYNSFYQTCLLIVHCILL
jgi:hypothetical protein